MKVYIKPWEEALNCAKKQKDLVDKFPEGTYIFGISLGFGNWGNVCTATKCGNAYTTVDHYWEFTYPACCVEEITPDWLEEHGEVFAKDGYKVDTSCELTDWDYNEHFNIIYKVKDALNTYFFYVHKYYEHGCERPVITDFREIK